MINFIFLMLFLMPQTHADDSINCIDIFSSDSHLFSSAFPLMHEFGLFSRPSRVIIGHKISVVYTRAIVLADLGGDLPLTESFETKKLTGIVKNWGPKFITIQSDNVITKIMRSEIDSLYLEASEKEKTLKEVKKILATIPFGDLKNYGVEIDYTYYSTLNNENLRSLKNLKGKVVTVLISNPKEVEVIFSVGVLDNINSNSLSLRNNQGTSQFSRKSILSFFYFP